MRGRPRKVEQETTPAQDLANRIWAGQSVSLPKHERVRRIRAALQARDFDPDSVVIG